MDLKIQAATLPEYSLHILQDRKILVPRIVMSQLNFGIYQFNVLGSMVGNDAFWTKILVQKITF